MLNKIIFSTLIILLPLLFSPFTLNPFTTPKFILLTLVILLLLLTWSINTLRTRSLTTSSSPLRLGLTVFATAIILNLLAYPSGRLEALIGPGSIYLLLCVWAYFLSLQTTPSLHKLASYAIIGGSTFLSLHSLAQLTFLYRVTALPLYMQTRAFTPTGSPLTTFILLFIGFCLSMFSAISTIHNQRSTKLIFTLSVMLHLIALVSLGYLIFRGGELASALLPLRASWNIALDAMKSTKSLILGVGLANFAIFYKSVKPLFLNATPFWNITPTSSGSELLQILTTTGILGFLSFLSLPFLALRSPTSDLPSKILLLVSGLALVFAPGSIPVLLLFFTSLGLLSSSTPHSRPLSLSASLTLTGAVLLAIGYSGYQTYRVAAAEINMHYAQVALTKNDGKTVYEQNLAAIRQLPAMTNYHLSFSQVNLSLAGALSQKTSLSDAERSNVTQLISQSIQEGKTATSLRPADSTSWQNLGSIYRNLINVATGSDQFAIQAYAQAVALDPGNPILRVEFGGLLYQLGQNTKKTEDQPPLFSRAQSEFQTAINLKSDFPNAYYNLAKLLETVKDYPNAYLAMQKAISLLGPDNPDLSRANTELEAIKVKVPKPSSPVTPAPSSSPTSVLTGPSPLPSPLPGGPVTIPVSN